MNKAMPKRRSAFLDGLPIDYDEIKFTRQCMLMWIWISKVVCLDCVQIVQEDKASVLGWSRWSSKAWKQLKDSLLMVNKQKNLTWLSEISSYWNLPLPSRICWTPIKCTLRYWNYLVSCYKHLIAFARCEKQSKLKNYPSQEQDGVIMQQIWLLTLVITRK